jgi:hypothetical protein
MTVRQIPGQVQGHKDAKGFHEITYYIPAGVQIVNFKYRHMGFYDFI